MHRSGGPSSKTPKRGVWNVWGWPQPRQRQLRVRLPRRRPRWQWWIQFGGMIEANWETERLRVYSSEDRDLLAALMTDSAWSNEGLFAFVEGVRPLREITK